MSLHLMAAAKPSVARTEMSMPITMNDLTINPDGIDLNTLLGEWGWAMPEAMRPVLLTAMGDVFAQGESGAVYFVDAVEGTINAVAEDGESFQTLLQDPQFVTDHMFPARIVELRNAGKTLQPQQVYSHTQLLVLGGDDDVENVDVTDASVHISMHGQVHRQVKDLPPGTPIGDITIE